MKQIYNVGIYCRLSVDDASNTAKARNYIPADESTSIENQRELLSKFAMLNGWVETRTYIDDGYTYLHTLAIILDSLNLQSQKMIISRCSIIFRHKFKEPLHG